MTATSFSSVSAEPPQILVCLNQSTDTGALVIEEGCFAVNILNNEQQSVSNEFAGGSSQEQRFANVNWQAGDNGAPLLTDAHGKPGMQTGSICEGRQPLGYYRRSAKSGLPRRRSLAVLQRRLSATGIALVRKCAARSRRFQTVLFLTGFSTMTKKQILTEIYATLIDLLSSLGIGLSLFGSHFKG